MKWNMKQNVNAVLASLCILLALVGCASTPTQQLSQKEQLLATLAVDAVHARQDGIITRAQLKEAQPFFHAAQDALFEAEKSLPATQPAQLDTFTQQLELFNSAIAAARAAITPKLVTQPTRSQ